jgi:hypothetical protein
MFWSLPNNKLDFNHGEIENENAESNIYTELFSLLLSNLVVQKEQTSGTTPKLCTSAAGAGIKATTIESLVDRPSYTYQDIETLAFHISLQLKVLERHGMTLLFWQPSDIIIIDNHFYFLANLQQLVPLRKEDSTKLVLRYPVIFNPELVAPELLQMQEIPFTTHRSASYYSLGRLCLHLWQKPLDAIQGTKLFYFIQRCLAPEPGQRICQVV